MRLFRFILLLPLLVALAACSTAGNEGGTNGGLELRAACTATPELPSAYSLDPFYDKYCMAHGLPILASEEVPDAALQQARQLLTVMLNRVSGESLASIAGHEIRIGVIGADQFTTDLPEHSDLEEAFPGREWDSSTRGVAATLARPLTSAAEENLLCYAGDVYAGESILVHEFAHTVHQQGVAMVDGTFDGRLGSAYDDANEAGLWQNTYAATDPLEYWAEGVQSYFEVNAPDDGVNHNGVNSAAELQNYDSALFDLVEEVFGEATTLRLCP